jgi:hypothetical protein
MTDLERAERACRQLAEKIREMAVGASKDAYEHIADSYDMLAHELRLEIDAEKAERVEFPEFTPTDQFGED